MNGNKYKTGSIFRGQAKREIILLCLLSILYLYIHMDNKQLTKVEHNKDLTAEEITFIGLVSKGMSATTAYRKAYPHKSNLSYNTIRLYACQLLAKDYISTEVQTTKERTARMARLAEERIEDILINDSSSVKGSKVADVAMFMYEQANGKATQKTIVEGKHVMVTYDLSGGQAGEVPQEILDQLAD